MLEELKQLEEKVGKLSDFLYTEKFYTLSEREQDLLSIQNYFMTGYLEILDRRIELFVLN